MFTKSNEKEMPSFLNSDILLAILAGNFPCIYALEIVWAFERNSPYTFTNNNPALSLGLFRLGYSIGLVSLG